MMSFQANGGRGDNHFIGTFHQDMRKTTGPPGLLFPAVLHEILKESTKFGHEDIISWLPNGLAFKIHDRDEFVDKVLPKYYPSSSTTTTLSSSLSLSLSSGACDDFDDEKTTSSIEGSSNDNRKGNTTTATKGTTKQFKWKSFLRQINLYGFERITKKSRRGNKSIDKNELGAYTHEFFRRDDESLCCLIQRKDGKSKPRFLPQIYPTVTMAAMSPVVVSSIKKKDEYKNSITNNNNNVLTMKSYDGTAAKEGKSGIGRNMKLLSGINEMEMSVLMMQQETKGWIDSDGNNNKETDRNDSSSKPSLFSIQNTKGGEGDTEKESDYPVGCKHLSSTSCNVSSLPSPSTSWYTVQNETPPAAMLSFSPPQETSSCHSTNKEEPSPAWKLSHDEHNVDCDGFGLWIKKEDEPEENNYLHTDNFSDGDITSTPIEPAAGTFSNILDTASMDESNSMISLFSNEGASTVNTTVSTNISFACTTHAPSFSSTLCGQQTTSNDGDIFIDSTTSLLGYNVQNAITTTTNKDKILDSTLNHRYLNSRHDHRYTASCTTADSIIGSIESNVITSNSSSSKHHKTMEEMIIENESLLQVLIPGIRISSPTAKDIKQLYPYFSPKEILQKVHTNKHQGIQLEEVELHFLQAIQPESRETISPNLPPVPQDWEGSTKCKSSTTSAMEEGLERYNFTWDEKYHGREQSKLIRETIKILADILEPDPI